MNNNVFVFKYRFCIGFFLMLLIVVAVLIGINISRDKGESQVFGNHENTPSVTGGFPYPYLQYKATVTEVISDYILNIEIMSGVVNLEGFLFYFGETPVASGRDDFILFKGEIVQIFFDDEDRRNRAIAGTIAQHVEVGTTINFLRTPWGDLSTDFEHDPPRVPAYAITILDANGEVVVTGFPGQ